MRAGVATVAKPALREMTRAAGKTSEETRRGFDWGFRALGDDEALGFCRLQGSGSQASSNRWKV